MEEEEKKIELANAKLIRSGGGGGGGSEWIVISTSQNPSTFLSVVASFFHPHRSTPSINIIIPRRRFRFLYHRPLRAARFISLFVSFLFSLDSRSLARYELSSENTWLYFCCDRIISFHSYTGPEKTRKFFF